MKIMKIILSLISSIAYIRKRVNSELINLSQFIRDYIAIISRYRARSDLYENKLRFKLLYIILAKKALNINQLTKIKNTIYTISSNSYT